MMKRFPIKVVLIFASVAMSLVPGDAVAHGSAAGSRGAGGRPNHAVLASESTQARLLLSDMSRPSERLPAGVPAWWDWAAHPRTRSLQPLRSFRAFTAWGQLYQCAGTPATPDASVDLKNLQAWVLMQGSSHWRRIQFSSDLGGAAFADDYSGPTLPGRYSASSAGTSARLLAGHNFHFWPAAGRVQLDASHVAAVSVALEARLAVIPRGAATPCLVLSVGGDMWSTLSAQAGGASSGDVGIGRFKRVGRHWRLFTMTTASAAVLHQHPVPPLAPGADDF